jgi:hypothetical protein
VYSQLRQLFISSSLLSANLYAMSYSFHLDKGINERSRRMMNSSTFLQLGLSESKVNHILMAKAKGKGPGNMELHRESCYIVVMYILKMLRSE